MINIERTTAVKTEVSLSDVSNRIYTLRGRQVMLDNDLAEIYDVETKVLKQAVKRNFERFPDDDFMFEPTQTELELLKAQIVTSNGENFSEADVRPCLRSQIVTSKKGSKAVGRGGSRYLPFAFTEPGVAMLSSVLHSQRAVQINIEIIRIFIQLRRHQRNQLDVVPKLESLEKMFKQRFDRLETQLRNQDASTVAFPSLPAMRDPIGLIQNTVARHFGLSSEDLKSSSRTHAISLPRQIAIYLARKNLCLGFSEIGRRFGGRDHTTILHAYRKILAEAEKNSMIRTAVDALGNQAQQQLA